MLLKFQWNAYGVLLERYKIAIGMLLEFHWKSFEMEWCVIEILTVIEIEMVFECY